MLKLWSSNFEKGIQPKKKAEIAKEEPFELLSFEELERLFHASQTTPLWERARFQDEYFGKIPQIMKGSDLLDILREAYHPEDFQHILMSVSSIAKQNLGAEYEYRFFGKSSAHLPYTSGNDEALFKINDLELKSDGESYNYKPYVEVFLSIPRIAIQIDEDKIEDRPFPYVHKTTLEIRSRCSDSYYKVLSAGHGSTNWDTFLLTDDGMRLKVVAEEYGKGDISKGYGTDVYFYRIFNPEDISQVDLQEAVEKAYKVFQFLDRYYEIKKKLFKDQMPDMTSKITSYIETEGKAKPNEQITEPKS